MRSFAVLSSAAAPVLLIGGWTLAESRQPPGYSPLRDAISDLAAIGATDRWIMTVAFVGVGLCHLITAYGLSEASRTGRLLLGAGGVATILVGVFPVPEHGSSAAHRAAATTAFLVLAAWTFFGAARTAVAAGPLRPPVSVIAGVTLLGLVAWFGLTLPAGDLLGLAERIAAAAQATWPCVVALGVRAGSRRRPGSS